MPSLDEILLAEARAMRGEGIDPNEGAFAPSSPRVLDTRLPNSFVDNVYDSVSVQPFWLLTKEIMDSNYPSEPDYDPLAPENIKGYEFYASTLREARSRAQADAMKQRIDTTQETKKRLQEESGIAEELIAEFANPFNYVPLGALRTGVGFARGVVRGGATFAPVVVAEEALRSQVDPTATREELLTNVATGVVFGGLIGGGIGLVGGRTGINRIATEFDNFQRAMDGEPVVVPEAAPRAPGTFVAEPTNIPTGVAPAFGLERATNRITGYRRLVSYGIRSLEDLANGMVGEFDLMFNRNKVGPDGTAPLPTQRSAYLEAGMWRGMAADTLRRIDVLYNEYLGGGPSPTTIGNVNIPVTMQRVGQAVGMRPSDGKMTYQDFMDAIFRAHKQDGVKADDPFVGKAATVVREFFDKARDEGVKTGFLFNQRFAAGAFAKYSERAARFRGEIESLQAKGTLTDKERVKLDLLLRSFANAQSNVRRYSLANLAEQRQISGAAPAPRTRVGMTPANDEIMQRRAEETGAGQPSAPITLVELSGDSGYKSKIFVNSNRVMTIVDINGVKIPFYISTGSGGKKAVPKGEWYPFFGFGPDDGWLNKGTEDQIVDFYGSKELRDAASWLNKNYGDLRPDQDMYPLGLSYSANPSSWLKSGSVNVDNMFNDLSPVDRSAGAVPLQKNIADVLKKIESGRKPSSSQPSAANQILQRFVNDDPQFNPANDGRIVIDAFTDNKSSEEAASLYETGKPFVADSFHGTKAVFAKFDYGFLGENTDAESARNAFFSSRDPATAGNPVYTGRDPNLVGWRSVLGRLEDEFLFGYITEGALSDLNKFKNIAYGFANVFVNMDPFEAVEKYALGSYLRTYFLDPDVHKKPVTLGGIRWQPGNTAYWIDGEDLFADMMENRAVASFGKRMSKKLDKMIAEARTIIDRYPVDGDAPNVQMLRIRMDNPLVYDFQGQEYREESYASLIKRAKSEGRDGVVMLNTFDGGGKDIIYAVFDPERMRARFDAESYEAAQRSARIFEGRPLNMPAPANEQDAAVAALRGAGGFERPRFGEIANENIPDYRGPANDPFYLPRQYDYEKIAADESGPKVLRSILTKYYTENPIPGLSVTEENVAKRVDSTMKTILGEAQTGELQVGKGSTAQFRMERVLDIPNELVADFLETDVSKLLRSYANRAGYAIELSRKFGSRDMQDAIDDALLQVLDELDGSYDGLQKTVNEIRDEITTLRDLATGDIYASNPSALSRKAVQALTGWAAITQMGGSAITALTESVKPILVHGVQRTLGFAIDRLSDPDAYRSLSEEARTLTGEGLEVVLNMHAHHYTEQGGLTAPGITKIGRAFDKATQPLISFSQGPYYIANLLGPVTDLMKTYSGAMSSHFMLEDVLKVASGKASKKTVEKLASYGISVDDAKRMADQPIEKLTKLRVANTKDWDDPDLVRQFIGAVAGETRRTIVTAGPANKPNIAQGFIGKGDDVREAALLRLPFQYMNFGFAALNKNLLSALQGRDANAFMGVTALLGAGYMVAQLKTPDSIWDKMPMEERLLRAINLSGILGIVGDIPNMIENASSGEYGIRPMLGLPPAYGYRMYDEYSSIGPLVGPGGGKVVDMYKLFVDDSTTEPEQARILRRMIPLNDAFYWKSLFTEAERGLTETLY
jgi:hypothetical protein